MEHSQFGVPLSLSTSWWTERIPSTFFQNVQHEIRTPLAIVLGYAELLRAGELGELSPEQRQVINIIVARAGRLRDLVEQASVLVDASLGHSEPRPLDLTALVRAAMLKWRRLKPDWVWEARLEPGVSLNGDPAQLSQALNCLLDNAVKFTPAGGRIEVSLDALYPLASSFHVEQHPCAARLAHGDVQDTVIGKPEVADLPCAEYGAAWARLAVRDSGIGLAEQDIACLLDNRPFYQVDGALNRCRPGCGLGLTLTKVVACLHGGWLEIGSVLGQGSCFALMLPMAQTQKW